MAHVQGRDLGASRRATSTTSCSRPERIVPRGSYVVLRGQVQTMTSAYSQLYFGLAGAIVLIYLVIVVNFQSWLDPFIIITALPAALAGIVWMLFMTGTTLSVPALTGAIMCMGIATANSILLVSFAREGLANGLDAARGGPGGRLYPLPSGADDGACHDHRHGADGAGPGRRRRAECAARPRGDRRPAVATVATLFFVPTVFSVYRIHGRIGRVSWTAGRGEAERRTNATPMSANRSPAPKERQAARRRGPANRFGLVALAARNRYCARRHPGTAGSRGRSQAMDAGAGRSDRRLISPEQGASVAALVLPGTIAGLVRGADLRARQRLSEGLVLRFWRARQERRSAGRNRCSRSRCPTRRRAGQAQFGQSRV